VWRATLGETTQQFPARRLPQTAWSTLQAPAGVVAEPPGDIPELEVVSPSFAQFLAELVDR